MNFEQISKVFSAYERKTVSTAIHPNDVMYNSGRPFYYKVGSSGVQVILTALSLTWRSHVTKVLDLPCGHGRIARHLPLLFPHAELFYCDVDTEGVDFCASTFGGRAIHSKPDLLEVTLPKNIDVIWIGSLFTHLDKQHTAAWLRYLVDHLSEHGVLITTFHGYFAEKHTKFHGGIDEQHLRKEFAETGFGYAPYVNYDSIQDYGISLSKPSAILDIADEIPGIRASYIERGWSNNHDVLILCRNDRLAVI